MSDTARTDNFLAHYGVKGMKWGVRKADKRAKSPDYEETRQTKKRSHKELSNSELQKAINRMNLEKQYKSLNPKGLSKANKIALSILALGTTVNSAIAFANTPAGKSVKNSILKLINK